MSYDDRADRDRNHELREHTQQLRRLADAAELANAIELYKMDTPDLRRLEHVIKSKVPISTENRHAIVDTILEANLYLESAEYASYVRYGGKKPQGNPE